MFAVPGLLALIFVEYIRPQEYLPALAGVPLLHIATALAIVGFILDLRLGLSRAQRAPHLVLTALFFVWCLVTLLVRAPAEIMTRAVALAIPFAIYVLVAHSVQSFRMLQVICALLLAIGVGLALLGVEQGFAPYGCHRIGWKNGDVVLQYDGRPCSETDRAVCEAEDAEPGVDYVCEKVGLFGTQSDHGRVRYRGTLEDPNELSLVLGIALPFAFAFFDRRATLVRLGLVVVTSLAVGLCAYFTQSRGGQLVFLAVLGVYFVRRFGVRTGVAVGATLGLPLLVFGGRAGAEASTMERLECWWTGLHMITASPGFGVGFAQFLEHHYLTAHNSFILATAELGLPGMLLWTSIVYVSLKIPIEALRQDVVPVARPWALAMLASIAGLVVGSFFLSFAYKNVLWIYVGVTGVLYHAIRRHNPEFEVSFRARDLGLLTAIDLSVVIALMGYTGSKLGW